MPTWRFSGGTWCPARLTTASGSGSRRQRSPRNRRCSAAGRLAATRRAEQAGDTALLETKIDAIHDGLAAIALDDGLEFKFGHGINYNSHSTARRHDFPNPAAARSPLVAAILVALLTGLPVASVGFNLFLGGTSTTWSHLASTVLPEYVANSPAPVRRGRASAWRSSASQPPGSPRCTTSRAAHLRMGAGPVPLAVPAYVMALDSPTSCSSSGRCRPPCANSSAGNTATTTSRHPHPCRGDPDVRLRALPPCLYLLASHRLPRTGRRRAGSRPHPGHRPWRAFFTVSLPLARLAIAAGVAWP